MKIFQKYLVFNCFTFVLFCASALAAGDGALHLPELMGVAIAEYQNSGADTVKKSNWAAWENVERPENPTIKDGQRSGLSCDHWNRYKEDIKLTKDLGLNAFRLSLDWSMMEPEQGKFDQAAIKHYHDVIAEMLRQGITPMVTLHHFTHPQWFEELGAFEDVLNLKFFVHFCTKMFEQFGNEVKLWCTINEPGAYIFQGYINKAFPPGVCNFQLAGEVLRNMLLAHVLVYRLLKKMPGGDEVQIGLVHQYMTFEPYNKWNLIEKIPTVYLNYIFNDVILNFLRTGEFSFCIPFKYMPFAANVSLDENGQELDLKGLDLEKRPYFDFIGLNFYSRAVVQQAKWNIFGADAIIPSCMDGEIMTDMQYPMYADGLYDAIKVMSEFNVPIYITENGIADAKDDRRELFFKDYLAAVSRAINDGFDVRGWFYWSLMDNFEWNDGFIPKFGLYEVDFQTKTRTLRPSVLSLQAMLSQHKGVL